MAGELVIIFITAASEQEAASISKALVEEGLIACANIIPQIRSLYRWEGKIWDEREWLLTIKTKRDRFDDLEKHIKSLHSYSAPEIIALPVVEGSSSYLKWVEEMTE